MIAKAMAFTLFKINLFHRKKRCLDNIVLTILLFFRGAFGLGVDFFFEKYDLNIFLNIFKGGKCVVLSLKNWQNLQ